MDLRYARLHDPLFRLGLPTGAHQVRHQVEPCHHHHHRLSLIGTAHNSYHHHHLSLIGTAHNSYHHHHLSLIGTAHNSYHTQSVVSVIGVAHKSVGSALSWCRRPISIGHTNHPISSASQHELVIKLVGALSPVNHKGLHQGWTQTSLYLQVIDFTSHHATSHFLWLFIFRGHSTREPASGRVTYFILRAYTGTMC